MENMERELIVSMVLEGIKTLQERNGLEEDILDTMHMLEKEPFDSEGAKQMVLKNNARHSDIAILIRIASGVDLTNLEQATEDDIRNVLWMQERAMCNKEYSQHGSRLRRG